MRLPGVMQQALADYDYDQCTSAAGVANTNGATRFNDAIGDLLVRFILHKMRQAW